MRLAGKVTIITGAGQGIGRAFALRFAQEGAHVVVADLQEEKAKHVAQEVQGLGAKGVAVKVDVSAPESVRAMVDQIITHFGRVDVMMNNAAIFSTIKRNGVLASEDIARAVMFAVSQPKHVNVNEMLVRYTDEEI